MEYQLYHNANAHVDTLNTCSRQGFIIIFLITFPALCTIYIHIMVFANFADGMKARIMSTAIKYIIPTYFFFFFRFLPFFILNVFYVLNIYDVVCVYIVDTIHITTYEYIFRRYVSINSYSDVLYNYNCSFKIDLEKKSYRENSQKLTLSC